MNTEKIASFKIIGLAVRTTNVENQSMLDIGALWERVHSEQIGDQIPNRIDEDLLSVYTDYEGGHMEPYTTLIGCRVSSLDEIPDGMTGKEIKGGDFIKITGKGKIPEVVMQTWMQVWNMDIERIYTSDFEVYGTKSHDLENAEIDIYVSVK